jgi:spore coat protein CotH
MAKQTGRLQERPCPGPLVAFLRFLSESDDATFASRLPDYLDVESFATYLATNNLLVNTDSMAGMGNNFYFYYDDILGHMTVLYWDGNESLSKLREGPGIAKPQVLRISC